MSWLKQKEPKIIDHNTNLPKPTVEEELRFLADSERFTENFIKNQSRKEKIIIYGATAVNQIVGPYYARKTSDIDVYSKNPLKHITQLENAIDHHTQRNISHIEEHEYTDEKGKTGKIRRLRLKNFNTIADYNKTPSNIKTVTKDGIKYETLDNAEKKYIHMINTNETKRIVNAHQDLDRIYMSRYYKKKIF